MALRYYTTCHSAKSANSLVDFRRRPSDSHNAEWGWKQGCWFGGRLDDSEPPKGNGNGGKKTLKERAAEEYSALKPFIIISFSYLLFTVTDGAVRMIVLLHAYNLGFTAWQTAVLFTLYELAGVFTNLLAGIAGARWGIKSTLLCGLVLQLGGLGMLFGWKESWSEGTAVVYVTLAQMLSGVAKDLTKLGGKTVTKLVTPDEKQSQLFKIVSLITGFKNSLKGAGYFLGAILLTVKYELALAVMCGFIVVAIPWAFWGLSNKLGRTRKENIKLSTVFKQNQNINILSLARFFLFGSRDLWFEVPLPFFLRDVLEWERPAVGAALAIFIIVYGQVQSWTPQLVLSPLKQSPPNKLAGMLWAGILLVCPAYMGSVILGTNIFENEDRGGMLGIIVSGISIFCVIFAVNSSVHSYLIVRYSGGDKVAMNVGFYYMANAAGRLTGTLVSGALYSFVGTEVQGFGVCFMASTGFAILASLLLVFVNDQNEGLMCGKMTLVQPKEDDEVIEKAKGDASTGV